MFCNLLAQDKVPVKYENSSRKVHRVGSDSQKPSANLLSLNEPARLSYEANRGYLEQQRRRN